MTLRLKVFGFEVVRVELEIPEVDSRSVTPIQRVVKGTSNWWVKRMNA
ncbi:hypothetical protein J4T99_gp052 [Mycobacterium phage Bromden]|uniref:Uncharacterized protein n=1 Tax=Mycobacterium phage Bromden TaxID=2283252 RepID=A0A345MBI7_9CAUD|nr:hypothetical protein J4T99_gp052 [Mycobacterium phage Bromden]AXH67858.1 hypothetical protein SEA_BROMDEN_52 [Mycobacterium phage Bromden]